MARQLCPTCLDVGGSKCCTDGSFRQKFDDLQEHFQQQKCRCCSLGTKRINIATDTHLIFLSTLASSAKSWQRCRYCAVHIVSIDECVMQDVAMLRALGGARAVRLPRHGAIPRSTLAITILHSIRRPKRLKLSGSSCSWPILPRFGPEKSTFRQVLWGDGFRLSDPYAPVVSPNSASELFNDSNENTKRSR